MKEEGIKKGGEGEGERKREGKGERDILGSNQNCTFSTVEKTLCRFEKDKNGNPFRICERNRELLRHCMGRPTEMIESSSEQIKDNKFHGSIPNWGFSENEINVENEKEEERSAKKKLEEELKTFKNREKGIFEHPFSRIWESPENPLRVFLGIFDEERERGNEKISEIGDFIRSAEDLVQDFFASLEEDEGKRENEGKREKGEKVGKFGEESGFGGRDRVERRDGGRLFGGIWPKERERERVRGFVGGERPFSGNESKKPYFSSDFPHSFEEV